MPNEKHIRWKFENDIKSFDFKIDMLRSQIADAVINHLEKGEHENDIIEVLTNLGDDVLDLKHKQKLKQEEYRGWQLKLEHEEAKNA